MELSEFEAAGRDFAAGRLREAEVRLREILAAHPAHAPSLHLLGLIAHRTGHFAAAADLMRQAAAAEPANPEFHNHLGLVLLLLGEVDQAIVQFRRVNEVEPGFADSRNSLGAALKRKGHVEEAIIWYREALRLRPRFPEASNNLGTALLAQGKLQEAIEAFGGAIAARPDYAEALSNLGNALRLNSQSAAAIQALQKAAAIRPELPEIHYNLGLAFQADRKFAEAEQSYRKALALRPDYADALNNLGNVLEETSRFSEAIGAYRQVLSLRPDLPEAHNNLGTSLRQTGALEQAIGEFRKAVELRPAFFEAYSNLGNALAEAGTLQEAEAAFGRSLAIKPGYAEAAWNLGLLWLLRGDFERGWDAYELRHQAKVDLRFSGTGTLSFGLDPEFVRSFWNGGELKGDRILLLGEQGFGDTLHFIRYAPLVARRGGKVRLLCQPGLRRLLTGQLGIEQIVEVGEALPEFDVCCPLMSLPHVFRTRIDTMPAEVPYLTIDPSRSQRWRERIERLPRRLDVGLVWAGNPTYRNDRNRSISLAALSPLAKAEGARFFSLQKGEAARQAQQAPAGMEIVDWTAELIDFSDTAALIDNLDLVISVDTAVAHLAGALGRPVWMLLPLTPDWRWMLGREDSPWYPTMRLFRQPEWGDWATPIGTMAEELVNAGQGTPSPPARWLG
ncbi:MAG TPA: tetratricopeptide repeat protein [Tepidisphaeraceae bacterium]|nr:tetratricopeptide repeat protein [Tepidisphaeraceae bacterium]